MEIVYAVMAGCILDLIFGDPQWLPHPIRFIGWLISSGEKILRKFCKSLKSEYICGVILTVLVLTISFAVPFIILFLLFKVNYILAIVIQAFMCYQIIATKSLKVESMKVYDELIKNDIENARKKLSWIVSRDTGSLDFSGITKSTIESISENASDGVIAPLIFMLIGGAPLGFLYKAVNTLDSMIGYKNDRYMNFGRFAANLDDFFNYIPARVSAYFMILASFLCQYDFKNAIKIYKRDKNNHKSPNSAHTEAACAGALNIQIAGSNYYFGKLVEKPTIGDDMRSVEAVDIIKANRLMYCTFMITLIVGILLRLIVLKVG